ncbi:MAG: transposase [Chloroflexi bacterium]|nr:transposase [Chloroflexota bacterium]
MTTKKRQRWTAERKLQIIEEARQTDHTVSEVCRHHGVATGQFYTWEKRARQGAMEALRNRERGRKKSDPTIPLRTEVERLRAVIAELSVENLTLKKGAWP